MSYDKPDGSDVQKPAGEGTQPAAENQNTPPANPTVEATAEQLAYMKGVGLENATLTPEFLKAIDLGMKQKSSVSNKELEITQLKAQLESRGQEIQEVAPAAAEGQPAKAQQPVTPTPEPNPVQGQVGNGISQNDIFDVTQMINGFGVFSTPEAAKEVFDELRLRKLFGVTGVDKKGVYDYLTVKAAQVKELQELRKFKEEYSQPDPNANATYTLGAEITADTEIKDRATAQAIVLAAIEGQQVDAKKLDEAREFLQK